MQLAEFISHCRLAGIHHGFVALPKMDLQGWNSNHPVFQQLLTELRPSSIIEVGSWKGASAIHMGQLARGLGLDCRILCVDAWLGGPGAYIEPDYFEDYFPAAGKFRMLEIFLTNVAGKGLTEMIFPMPSTSLAAAASLAVMKVTADLIYIDAGHGEHEVRQDLEAYWPIVRDGGILLGDDYQDGWPGVMAAADGFARKHGLPLTAHDNKFVIRKPARS